MHDQLMAEIEKLGTADGWKALLQIRSRLHHYSFRNVMTILSQRPDATMIAGFNDWVSKHKRVPQKGTAIFYWAPHTSKEVDPSTGKEEEKLGFHLTFGFDISDTKPLDPDAPELPIKRHAERLEGQPPAALWDGLTAILGKLGYRVEVTEIEGGAKGDTSPDGLVRIDSRNAPMERVAVLIHELAHVFCGHLDDMDDYQAHRGRSEVEAESVAWIAMKACGMDVERWSFEYIDGWAKGDMELIQETATKVCKVSDQLIDALDAEIGKEIEKEGVSL